MSLSPNQTGNNQFVDPAAVNLANVQAIAEARQRIQAAEAFGQSEALAAAQKEEQDALERFHAYRREVFDGVANALRIAANVDPAMTAHLRDLILEILAPDIQPLGDAITDLRKRVAAMEGRR